MFIFVNNCDHSPVSQVLCPPSYLTYNKIKLTSTTLHHCGQSVACSIQLDCVDQIKDSTIKVCYLVIIVGLQCFLHIALVVGHYLIVAVAVAVAVALE